MKRIVLIYCLAFSLSGCTLPNMSDYVDQGDAIAYSSNDISPTRPADVRLYYFNAPRDYKVLGRVVADNENMIGIPRSPLSIAAELRSQAAKLGANAVVDIVENAGSTTGKAVLTNN